MTSGISSATDDERAHGRIGHTVIIAPVRPLLQRIDYCSKTASWTA